MLRDTLSEFAYTPWSLAGLIFFVLMFVLLLAWVYRIHGRGETSRHALEGR